MPTATLLKPASLRRNGRTWTKGKVEPVTPTLAAELRTDPRFQVLNYEPETLSPGEAPARRVLTDKAILEAIDTLDLDDDAYDDAGRPKPEAVSIVLGRKVSEKQIAAALKAAERGLRVEPKDDEPVIPTPAAEPAKADTEVCTPPAEEKVEATKEDLKAEEKADEKAEPEKKGGVRITRGKKDATDAEKATDEPAVEV